MRARNNEATAAGSEAARKWLDGPRTSLSACLSEILQAAPLGARDRFRAGFVDTIAAALPGPTTDETASQGQCPADLGAAVPDLLRCTLLEVADANRMLNINARTTAARRSVNRLTAIGGAIQGDDGLLFTPEILSLIRDLTPRNALYNALYERGADASPFRVRLVARRDPGATGQDQDA